MMVIPRIYEMAIRLVNPLLKQVVSDHRTVSKADDRKTNYFSRYDSLRNTYLGKV